MKKYLSILLISTSLFATASCSSDDDSYNADDAVTSYNPMPSDIYKTVKGIKVTQNYNGKDYSWDYNFDYDAHNRIKSVNCDIVAYAKDDKGKYHKVTGTISTDYRFEDNNMLVVDSRITNINFNDNSSYRYVGEFNRAGYLEHFGPFSCVYSSSNRLSEAYLDNERKYSFEYEERYGNITGYVCDSVNKRVEQHNIYEYHSKTNKTNIDIAGFIGNCIIEREISGNENKSYPILFLSAFDMLGTRSNNLPEGNWVIDNNLPLNAVLPTGQKLEFRY